MILASIQINSYSVKEVSACQIKLNRGKLQAKKVVGFLFFFLELVAGLLALLAVGRMV